MAFYRSSQWFEHGASTTVLDEMPAPLPGGVVRGVVRSDSERLRIAEMHVALDTMTSQPFSAIRS